MSTRVGVTEPTMKTPRQMNFMDCMTYVYIYIYIYFCCQFILKNKLTNVVVSTSSPNSIVSTHISIIMQSSLEENTKLVLPYTIVNS